MAAAGSISVQCGLVSLLRWRLQALTSHGNLHRHDDDDDDDDDDNDDYDYEFDGTSEPSP